MIPAMPRLLYILLVFLVVLGPGRLLSAFAEATAERTPAERRRLALRTVLLDGAALSVLAILGVLLRQAWSVSWEAWSIGIGLILLLGALHRLYGRPRRPASAPAPPPRLSALTPYGVAFALLVFPSTERMDVRLVVAVFASIALVCALNFVALTSARRILGTGLGQVGQAAGWACAVVLAVVAVQAIADPIEDLASSFFPDDGPSRASRTRLAAVPGRAHRLWVRARACPPSSR